MINPDELLQRHGEKIKLIGYFVLIIVLSWPITNMLTEAWGVTYDQRGLSNAIIRFIRFGILGPLISDSHQTLTSSVLGLYIGLLSLMTVDRKKRWQAFLMWVGTILALVALQFSGLVLPQLDIVEQGPTFLGGVVLGLVLGGGRKLSDIPRGEFSEFRRASQALFILMVGFVVIGFIELHVQYPGVFVPSDNPTNYEIIAQDYAINANGVVFDGAVSAAFIITLRQFVQYDTNRNFFIVGPRASGKSLALIGMYLQVLQQTRENQDNTPLEPSQDLMSMIEGLDRQESDWIVEATGRGEIKYLQFQYVYGDVFPRNIKVSALDYAGEYLTLLPDAISGTIDEEDIDGALEQLIAGVESADTLLFTLDVERFVNGEPLDISEYFSILQEVGNENIIIMATKADVITEEFAEEQGLEAHRNYEEFTKYVNNRLRRSENIDTLVAESGGAKIHPVYYQTKVKENGDRVPIRDEQGSVMTVGFDEMLDIMGGM
jgi:hypothetical protein